MFDLTIKIINVHVIRRASYTDHITLSIEAPPGFPDTPGRPTGYCRGEADPCLEFQTRKGYAEEWLALIGIPPDLITVTDMAHK